MKLNEQHTGFIIESYDAAVSGYLGWLSNNNILIPFQLN